MNITIEYMFLDAEERALFAGNSNTMIVEQNNYNQCTNSTKKSFPKEFKNHSKEICGICIDITPMICQVSCCKQHFCLECLKKWQKDSCPTCRQSYKIIV